MPRLTHLAIVADDPSGLSGWYERWFALEVLGRTPEGSVYLTDGYFTLGLLARGATGETAPRRGLHHIGFTVERLAEIERNLEEFDPAIRIEEAPRTDPYARYRIRDPEGVIVDLAEDGFGADGPQRVPGIRHVAMFNRDPHRKAGFYRSVFGMRDATRTDDEVYRHLMLTAGQVPAGFQRSTSPFCGDGFINMALLGRDLSEEEAARRAGLDHFGMLVREPLELVQRLGQVDAMNRPSDRRPPERQVEYGVRDPEGNRIDVSGRKGWKVDVDRWARIEE